jgi:DNA-directed RNA polymerase subunit RPC12/RpoP
VTSTGNSYTCESCGKTFDSDWSDEDAAAEAQENFPGIDTSNPNEAAVVCDDCYQHIMADFRGVAPN